MSDTMAEDNDNYPDLWNGPAPMPSGYSPGGSDAMVKALNTPACHPESGTPMPGPQ